MADRLKTRHRGVYTRGEGRQKRYIVWYADSNGKGHTETLPLGSSEKDALARQAELRGKKARGERVVPTSLRLEEWLDLWLEEQKPRLRASTVVTYECAVRRLKDRLGRRRLRDVDVDVVARMVAEMQRSYKAWTIRGTLVVLSRAMQTAVRRGYVGSNPVAQLDKSERPKGDQKRMRILGSEEIFRLLPAVPAFHRALITTLVFTGMRIGEALALEWADVDFDAGLIHVRAGKTENAARSIVLMPSLARVLRAHMVSSGRREGLVFGTARGTKQDRENVLKRGLQKGLKNAGLERLTLHELRHTFASILIGQGFDVTFVADQLGHADPAITLRVYAKLFDPASRRDEARERLQQAFGTMVA